MDLSEIDFLNALQQSAGTMTTFGQFRTENNIGKLIDGFDFDDALIKLSGLLYEQDLHSNLVTTETMIHQLFLSQEGNHKLGVDDITTLFDGIKSTWISSLEDPAEDTMIGQVHSIDGSYKCLNGLWESSYFYTQIFVDLIDKMPDGEPFYSFKKPMKAILALSNESINRTNLKRYQKGNDQPCSEWDFQSYMSSPNKIVCFSVGDLNKLEISEEDLEPFIFEKSDISKLNNEDFGNSSLERRPIYRSKNGTYILALPTAISIALRLFIIEQADKFSLLDKLEYVMKSSYMNFFGKRSNLLGKKSNISFIPFYDSSKKFIGAESFVKIDSHRYIQFLLFFDDFNGYQDGFVNNSTSRIDLENVISKRINKAYSYSSQKEGFKKGLTVLIGCGWGRSIMFPLEHKLDSKNWLLETVSAPDLDTFNRITGMTPLSFWRLIEAKDRVREVGIYTPNMNGLLNLYGWAKDNDFNIIPNSMFDDDDYFKQVLMMISQNSLLDVRYDVQNEEDKHQVITPDNEIVMVQRITKGSYFKEDHFKPIYTVADYIEKGKLIGLIEGNMCSWWCAPLITEKSHKDLLYRIWSAICNWIYRVDVVLSELNYTSYYKNVYFSFEFEDVDFSIKKVRAIDIELLDDLTEICVSFENDYIYINCIFLRNYIFAFNRSDNAAEKNIIKSLITAFIRNSVEPDKSDQLVKKVLNKVFTDRFAKDVHMRTGETFLEFIKMNLPSPLILDRFDYSTLKIGLGLIAENNNQPFIIKGKIACTKYLQELTFKLWSNIRVSLSSLNKEELISFLLENHAATEVDTIHWQQTFKAMLGLHIDKEDVYSVTLDRISSNHAVQTGSRILIEMAICECSSEGGFPPNELDISKLITFATLIFQYGNLSDAIMYELIDPSLRISSYGDVRFDHSSYDSVVNPYGQLIQTEMINRASDKSEKHFSAPIDNNPVDGLLAPEFESAWNEEFGISIDDIRKILDIFESIGIEKKKAVYVLSFSELFDKARINDVSNDAIKAFTDRFSLQQRTNWNIPPLGFQISDISPWKFKRRLSSTARPLIRLEDKLIISPSLIRRGAMYCLFNSYEASLDGSFFNTKVMKQWIGNQRNKVGHSFNQQAAEKFSSLGWQTESEVKITKILKEKTKKNFGDIDVLAWNRDEGIVYLIECKDLEFAKTEGEIAKQIYEFRGVTNSIGKPDRLKKHLDRFQILSDNIDKLQQYLKIETINELKVMLLFKQSVPITFDNSNSDVPITLSFFDNLAIFNKKDKS